MGISLEHLRIHDYDVTTLDSSNHIAKVNKVPNQNVVK